MREKLSKVILRVMISFMLASALVVSALLPSVRTEAAEKPSINKTITIGTGSINFYNPYAKDDYNMLTVSNAVKKATYSFTSSNKNIVTVTSKGTTAYLVGVKPGSATITCNQKLNGKTTKIGACKVTVEAATVYSMYSDLPLGQSATVGFDYYRRNCDAKYTYVSDNKNLEVKDNVVLTYGGSLYLVSQIFTAKKTGTYKVTAYETYNKVKRKVGTITFEVHKASIPTKEFDMYIKDTQYAYYLMEYFRYDVPYTFEVEDKSIIKLTGKGLETQLEAIKEGTTLVNIYEDANKPDKKKLLGSCKITVKQLVVEKIEAECYTTDLYVGDDPVSLYLSKYPYNAPGTFTVTSSEPAVATVSEPDENNNCKITPVGAGTTTITARCEGFEETITITVLDNESEDADYDEW